VYGPVLHVYLVLTAVADGAQNVVLAAYTYRRKRGVDASDRESTGSLVRERKYKKYCMSISVHPEYHQ
jgi:hypothetical protein